MNFATGEHEDGVSAYGCQWNPIEGCWEACGSNLMGALIAGNLIGRDVFLVEGDELETAGSDGEPLLGKVRVLGSLVPVSDSPFCTSFVEGHDHRLKKEARAAQEPSKVSLREESMAMTDAAHAQGEHGHASFLEKAL